MNPQPPVTNMRMEASPSSGAESALAVFPTWGERLTDIKQGAAEINWVPWAIGGLAPILRLIFLGMKPPHFDEGINGWFVDQMAKNGFYRYDPTNYHGPLHFYVLFLSQTLLGRNIWALRLPVVLVSIACVWLTLKFEPFVGRTISRLAALAMAVSPGFVFYGRYSIHEVWILFFTILFLFGMIGLWKVGSAKYLWCAGMGLTGMILSKETYILHVGCAIIAAVVLPISNAIASGAARFVERTKSRRGIRVASVRLICRGISGIAEPLEQTGRAKQTWDYVDLVVVIGTAIALLVAFYSGFFFHWSGVKGLYQAYAPWFTTGKEGHGHEKAWYYWIALIGHYELPALAGLLVCVFALRFKTITLRYLAIYGVGTLMAR